jgi:alanyl-tRNA synthetase
MEVNVTTRRLFDEDSHCCAFSACVVAARSDLSLADTGSEESAPVQDRSEATDPSGGVWVSLDATAFFPEEGGQRADRGHLSGVAVDRLVIDREGTIWHHLDCDPGWAAGQVISGNVDPIIRRDHRQQHSGQHVLSRVITERLNAATRSFHMGEDDSTIDIDDDGRLDLKLAAEIENRANAVVMDDLAVTIVEEPRAGQRPLRTVVIEGLERQHCCGTHVRRTGEVGSIKILSWESAKGLTRIHFVCGERALSVFQRLVASADQTARLFSVGWFDLPGVAAGLIEEAKRADRMARQWQKRWAVLEVERLASETPRLPDGTLRIAAWIAGGDAETLRAAARQILERGQAIAVLAGEGEQGKRPWIAARTEALPEGRPFDARDVLRAILDPLGGRGGGTALFAQGSCPAGEDACVDAVRRVGEDR